MPGEGPVLIPNPLPALTGSTGGGAAHENMPPYIALRFVLIAR
jgi:microcystin-dependent protein